MFRLKIRGVNDGSVCCVPGEGYGIVSSESVTLMFVRVGNKQVEIEFISSSACCLCREPPEGTTGHGDGSCVIIST